MAFIDALQDSVTIYTVTIGFKSGDTVGQEVKTESELYTSVPGRLNSGNSSSISGTNRTEEGKQEKFKHDWVLEMPAQYNGAKVGDKAVINSINYIITKKQEMRGRSQTIHHVAYSLEEAN